VDARLSERWRPQDEPGIYLVVRHAGCAFVSNHRATVLATVLASSASGVDELTADPAGVIRCEEHCCCGDVVRLANAAERRAGFGTLVEVRTDEASGVGSFGFDEAGVESVDSNALGSKLEREDAGDDVDGALGRRVDGAGGWRNAADERTDVDDAAALGEVLGRGLRDQQEAEDVDIELLVEVFGSDGLKGQHFVDTRVVDEDVEFAIGLKGRIDDGLRVGGLGDVALDGYGFAAGLGDGLDDHVGTGFAGGVVNDHGGASGSEGCGDCCADAFRGSCNDGDFSCEGAHVNLLLSIFRYFDNHRIDEVKEQEDSRCPQNYWRELGEVGLEAVEVGAEDVRLGEVIHELTVFFAADQAGGLEFFHVVGECRR
jgi:hypothetical protein